MIVEKISEKQRSEKNWILGVLKRNIFGVYGGIPSVVVFGVGNGDGGRRDLMEMVVVVIHYISMGLVMGLPTLLEIIIFFFSRRN